MAWPHRQPERAPDAAACGPSRRDVLNHALSLATLAFLPAGYRSTLGRTAEMPAAGASPAYGETGTRLVLLGTRGGPGIDPSRAQTASALVAEGTPYLIDCGYGTLRQLVASRVGYLQLSTIFLTHLHDDHTADLAALLDFQWTNGKSTPTDAYGPYGTARLVQAALSVMRTNVEIRTVDEGRSIDADKQFHGHDVPAASAPVQIFKDGRITVTAVENAHYPARSKVRMAHRSLALRFDAKARSIVFTGDTAYSSNVVELARNADLFVCEIIDPTVLADMRRRAGAAAAAGSPNNIYRHVAETHSSPADVARMATEAHVKTVVLNHQVVGAGGPLGYPVTAFIQAVRKGFAGEVIVGNDLMVL